MEEGSIRPAVDDVERRLEHAEERQRRPEEGGTTDDSQRRRVVLNSMDEADDLIDRRSGKGLLDLPDEKGGFVRATGQPKQRERQEGERDEGQQGEVGDHRREVSSAVFEELPRQAPPAHS